MQNLQLIARMLFLPVILFNSVLSLRFARRYQTSAKYIYE